MIEKKTSEWLKMKGKNITHPLVYVNVVSGHKARDIFAQIGEQV